MSVLTFSDSVFSLMHKSILPVGPFPTTRDICTSEGIITKEFCSSLLEKAKAPPLPLIPETVDTSKFPSESKTETFVVPATTADL